MKTLFFLALISLSGIVTINQAKNAKTVADLKNGFKGETTASAKYAAFATKASGEGHESIAKLFKSASKAESIHAANHAKVLESLSEKPDNFVPQYDVKTTAENLQAAADGEKYEATTMYPQFLTDAKAEKIDKAIQSFNWASDTEKKHLEFYNNALVALINKQENSLPAAYAVCPVCGNTYDNAKADTKCSFCQTSKDKFIII